MSEAEKWVELIDHLGYDENPYDKHYNALDSMYVTTNHLGSGRWTEFTEHVFKCDDGSYFAFVMETGLTEYQDCNYGCDVYLVKPVQMMVTKYEKVED